MGLHVIASSRLPPYRIETRPYPSPTFCDLSLIDSELVLLIPSINRKHFESYINPHQDTHAFSSGSNAQREKEQHGKPARLERRRLPLHSVRSPITLPSTTQSTNPLTRRTLHIPFPSNHLAHTALRAISVDAELSPLVRRSFSLTTPSTSSNSASTPESEKSVLQVNYAATTNRMLRVAVNGFIESIGVVIGVMKDLDTDVVYEATKEGLEGVQGLEMGKVG